MRMRFKPYARPELLACDFHVHEPLTHGGHWHELYARPDQPWHLELGCGKGGFLAQIAPAHPDIILSVCIIILLILFIVSTLVTQWGDLIISIDSPAFYSQLLVP